MIGEVHRYLLCSKWNKCAIYGVELRSVLLCPANQQVEINKIQTVTTLAKVAATCWQLMFTHFASGALLDNGENMPNSPRYSIQKYHEWKRMCFLPFKSNYS